MGSRRKLSSGEQLEAAVDSARSILASKGAATGAQLGSPAVRPQVVQRLCGEGYEPTATGVRVALDVQCARLLADGKPVPLPELKRRLKGVNASEAKDVVGQLRRASKANVVLRGKQQCLVPPSASVLDRAVLKTLADKLKVTMTWLDKARKDKALVTVLTADVSSELAALDALLGESSTKGDRPAPEASVPRNSGGAIGPAESVEHVPLRVALRGAILALRDEDSRLARIPDVSRRLRQQASPREVIDVLLSEFQRGKLELRPEGGLGRLSPEDSALCPAGAGGLLLSWVVLLEE